MALVGIEIELVLEDGGRCILRDARLGDEAGLFALEEANAPDALAQGEDEDTPALPVEDRAQWIRTVEDGEAWIALVAEEKGEILGMLEFKAHDLPRLTRHVGRFYISLRGNARGRGIGRALMEMMLDWARSNPRIEKVALSVLSSNIPAIRLYESLGFTEEGRRLNEFKIPGGGYADDVLMAIFV